MPYISSKARKRLMFERPSMIGPGELNYAITLLIRQYIKDFGLRYSTINDVVGALEGAKLEFYRRVAAPYEDTKKEENGDVYE